MKSAPRNESTAIFFMPRKNADIRQARNLINHNAKAFCLINC